MRKRAHRVRRPAVVPCLVAVGLNTTHEATMLQAVQSFRVGRATADHFLDLCDARDITVIAHNAQGRDVPGMVPAMEAAQIALLNIRDRRQETGKFGATGDELAALAMLADFYMSFWLAQSGDLFRKARTELHRIRREQESRERAA